LCFIRDMCKSNNIQSQQVCRRCDMNKEQFQAFGNPPASIGLIGRL